MTISLAQQIEEVERELSLRRKVYPHMIATNKMRQSVSDFHIDRMSAVKATLEWLQSNEIEIREYVRQKREKVDANADDSIRQTDGAAKD